MTPRLTFPACLLLSLLAVSLAAPPAAADQTTRTILINPFFNLRTDFNSNAQGVNDPGNIVFRTLAGTSLRLDFPGGLGIIGHYQGQLLITRAGQFNTSVHSGTFVMSYRTPISGFIDTVMPYLGVQIQYREPTGVLAGTARFDSDAYAGLMAQHAPTTESVIYLGAHFDYFRPSDNRQMNYGPSMLAGYRQILGSTALVGVNNRLQYRLANNFGRTERWRDDMSFEVYYFPWPWLMLNPSAGLQYNSTGDFLTWTTGISVSTNLWFERSTPARPAAGPTRPLEYRDDLRQILLDTTLVPSSLGLPGDIALP